MIQMTVKDLTEVLEKLKRKKDIMKEKQLQHYLAVMMEREARCNKC